MKNLIKILFTPFIIVAAILAVVYVVVDFTWFTAKDMGSNLAKYIGNKTVE